MKIVLPVSRTFPKRSRNGVLFVAIGALATVASHLPTKHEVLPHTFSPLFSFFFSTTQSRFTTHNQSKTVYHSRVPQTSWVDRGSSKGRRGGWNPNRCIDPSSRRRPPSSMLIRSVYVDHGRLIRIGFTANALFIDRDIDGDRGAKIKPKRRPLVPETYSRWLHLDYWKRDIAPIYVILCSIVASPLSIIK